MKKLKPPPFPVFFEAFTRSLLSPMQLATLYALFKTNNGTIKQVAGFMGRAPATARYHLRCMANKSLVQMQPGKRPFRVSPAFLARYQPG